MNGERGNLYGFLEVTVLNGAIFGPVEGAKVDIFANDESDTYLVTSGITDNGGSVGPFRLSANEDDYNSPSASVKNVKRYIIEVTADGFYKRVKENVPVFPDIVSRDYVNLVPRADEIGKTVNNINETNITDKGGDSFPGGGT